MQHNSSIRGTLKTNLARQTLDLRGFQLLETKMYFSYGLLHMSVPSYRINLFLVNFNHRLPISRGLANPVSGTDLAQ